MRSVLITGGTGAFGTACARKLLTGWPERSPPDRLVIYSRGEHRQAEMQREFAEIPAKDDLETLRLNRARSGLRFFIGDVRDQDRLRRAMQGIDVVIHAAALKRIEVGAYNPMEVMKTNILGSANVIQAATDAGVGKVIALSTDKAFEPVSPYGTSKAFAESLFLNANNARGEHGPHFSVVRYGNVWGSTGSVVPTWRAMLKTQRWVPVTDPECTRFYMTIGEAVDLVLKTAERMQDEIVIPTLPAYRLGDLAEAMKAEMKIIGLPKYEKRHESMGPGNSSDNARRMSIDELRAILKGGK